MGLKGVTGDEHVGLAVLLDKSQQHENVAISPSRPSASEVCKMVGYILGIAESELSPRAKDYVDYSVVDALIGTHIEQLSNAVDAPSTSYDTDSGRIGPAVADIDRESMSGSFGFGPVGLTIESLANFSSCRANVAVYKGKWMYEATVLTAGIQQIGYATINCPFTGEEGVGDAPDSYAVDLMRKRKWNVKPQPYGQQWSAGDVIGCALDLDKGELTFYRNGESMGVAYAGIRRMQPSLAYFPSVSLSLAERCDLNFGGARKFQYPIPEYRPLQEPPAPQQQRAAAYLCACLQRLVRLVDRSDSVDPNSMLLPRTPIAWDDVILITAALVRHLEPLLVQEYFATAALLPCLLDLHKRAQPHRSNAVQTLVRLLRTVMDGWLFDRAFSLLLEALSRYCGTAPLEPKHFPHSSSYPYLALAAALTRHDAIKQLWLNHPEFSWITEGFLTRKTPSPDDLKLLLPRVWWRGMSDPANNRQAMADMRRVLGQTITLIEEKQYQLIGGLIGEAAPGTGGEDAFMVLLRQLLLKNQGAMRDVHPPGLSDGTVIVSMYFILLKLIQPQLARASSGRRRGDNWPRLSRDGDDAPPLSSFPAAQLFGGAGEAALQPVHELPRLGGVISHLLREVKMPRGDEEDVLVAAAPTLHYAELDEVTRKLAPSWLPELINAAMLLYCWTVGHNIKMIHQLSSALTSHLCGLDEIERQLARTDSPAEHNTHLRDAQVLFMEEAKTTVRTVTLLKEAFFSGWKQEAMFTTAAYVAALLLAVAKRKQLLAYIPTCYMDYVLDFLSAHRRAEAAFATPDQLLEHGFHKFVSVLVCLQSDPRIVHPDVQEAILQAIAFLLDYPEYIAAFEQNADARAQLVPAAMAAFDTRLWHPVSNILLRLIKDFGFGHQAGQPRPSALQSQLPVFQQLLKAYCQSGSPGFRGFLNRLFNMLNWAMTEFTVTVADLHEHRAARRAAVEQQQQLRRCAIMFELSLSLLRLLEFVATQAPEALLEDITLTRLFEILGFVLSHFTSGPAARRLNELLQSQQPPQQPPQSALQAVAPTVQPLAPPSPAPTAAGTSTAASAAAAAAGPAATVAAVAPVIAAAAAAAAAAAPPAGPLRPLERQSLVEKVSKAAVLAPVVGMLLGLAAAATAPPPVPLPLPLSSRRHSPTGADLRRQSSDAGPRRQSGDLGFGLRHQGSDLSMRHSSDLSLVLEQQQQQQQQLLQQQQLQPQQPPMELKDTVFVARLAEMCDPAMLEYFKFVEEMDWCGVFPNVPLSGQLREFGRLLDAVRAARKLRDDEAHETNVPDEEVPDDFLDPITMTIMRCPVVLPDSQVTVDRSTIERHLMTQHNDPFSRAPLALQQVLPNRQLQDRIDAFWAERQQKQKQDKQQRGAGAAARV